jgi:hypothetical protein
MHHQKASWHLAIKNTKLFSQNRLQGINHLFSPNGHNTTLNIASARPTCPPNILFTGGMQNTFVQCHVDE